MAIIGLGRDTTETDGYSEEELLDGEADYEMGNYEDQHHLMESGNILQPKLAAPNTKVHHKPFSRQQRNETKRGKRSASSRVHHGEASRRSYVD